MFDLNAITRIKNDWTCFLNNHPKISPFLNNVKYKGSCAGQEIAIAIRYPDGTEYKTGIRLTETDMDLMRDISGLMK